MTDSGGLSRTGLGRMREVLGRAVERGEVPGLVALVHRRGRTHVLALGPAFPSGGGGPGLLSTADDYLTFCRMLLNKGRYDGGRLLSRPAVEHDHS